MFPPQNDFVVETSLIGTVMNGLSHLHGCTDRSEFIISLIRGLGGNLNMKSRNDFAKEVVKPKPAYIYVTNTSCLLLYNNFKPVHILIILHRRL